MVPRLSSRLSSRTRNFLLRPVSPKPAWWGDGVHAHALEDRAVAVDDEVRRHILAVGEPVIEHVARGAAAFGVVQDYVLLVLCGLGSVVERAVEALFELELGGKAVEGAAPLLRSAFLGAGG